MTVDEALNFGITKLRAARVDSPELDAEVLFCYTQETERKHGQPILRRESRVDRAWLYAHGEQHISRTTLQHYQKSIARRVRREPVAYIIGRKEFFGLDFLVNKDVLIPRPETEVLVEQALQEIENWKLKIGNCVVVDVGTGSGAIAVAVAKECKMKNVKCKMVATEISGAALRVAKQNARRYGVEKNIAFLRGNLMETILDVILSEAKRSEGSRAHARTHMRGRFFGLRPQNDGEIHLVITANLPYLPTAEWRATAPEVRKWEPRGALDGGRSGLKYYREMFRQLKQFVILNHDASGRGEKSRANARRAHAGGILRRCTPQDDIRCVLLCELCPEQFPAFKKMVYGIFSKIKSDQIGTIAPIWLPVKIEEVRDLSGRKRVAVVRITGGRLRAG